MDEFYKFNWAKNKDEIFIEPLTEYDDQKLKLGLSITVPSVAKISEGKTCYDIIRFQDPYNFAISERVKNLLESENINGWNSYEIKVKGISEKYFGFQVIGKCGKLKRPDKAGFVFGYEFEYESWDLTDIFCPELTMSIFCTQKVVNLFSLNKITNVEFCDIKTAKWYST